MSLIYNDDIDTNRDDAEEEIISHIIKYMKKLEDLFIMNYHGVNLPNSISHFQNMRSLCLTSCFQLREILALEIGSKSTHINFPMLENMELWNLDNLESITSLFIVRNEEQCLNLKPYR